MVLELIIIGMLALTLVGVGYLVLIARRLEEQVAALLLGPGALPPDMLERIKVVSARVLERTRHIRNVVTANTPPTPQP